MGHSGVLERLRPLATYKILKVHLECIGYLFVSVSSELNGHTRCLSISTCASWDEVHFLTAANWHTSSTKVWKISLISLERSILLRIYLNSWGCVVFSTNNIPAVWNTWIPNFFCFKLWELFIFGRLDHKLVFWLHGMKSSRTRPHLISYIILKLVRHLFPLLSSLLTTAHC